MTTAELRALLEYANRTSLISARFAALDKIAADIPALLRVVEASKEALGSKWKPEYCDVLEESLKPFQKGTPT